MKRRMGILGLVTLLPALSWGHARLTGPVPRSNNSGIKTGPCGGLARTNTPTAVQGGTMLTVTWEETINHPGKYIFSLSMANDQNFTQNVLKQVVDVQDGSNDIPHRYTTQVPIPDINCPTCTLQLIQSMEENPAAPTYYYSCADLNIISSTGGGAVTPPPAGGSGGDSGNNTQSSNGAAPSSVTKFGGGCGLVQASNDHHGGSNGPSGPAQRMMILLAVLTPLLVAFKLRFSLVAAPRTASRNK